MMFRTSVSCLFSVAVLAAWVPAEGATHAFDKGMSPVLNNYIKIQKALAADSKEGVREAARAIVGLARKLDGKSVTGEHAEHYRELPQKVGSAATALSKAEDISAMREAFKQLSKPMAMWGTMSTPDGIDVLFCSMAKGSWLQKSGDVRNPYFGAEMLTCGEVVGGASHVMSGKKHGDHGSHH